MRGPVFLSLCCVIFALTSATAATVPANRHAAPAAWPAETLTGTVMMVEANRNLVVVEGADRVPFDLRVTPSTHIRSGNKSLRLQDLTSDQNKPVSVTFVPTGAGDVARVIRITG